MKNLSALITTLVIVALATTADAKRPAPKDVEPVIHNGIKYLTPHFKIVDKQVRHGYVEAWDIKSNKKLWDLQIYKTAYDPSLERDVQDVFIVSLSIQSGHLIVTNERGEKYEVNLETKEVKRLTPNPSLQPTAIPR